MWKRCVNGLLKWLNHHENAFFTIRRQIEAMISYFDGLSVFWRLSKWFFIGFTENTNAPWCGLSPQSLCEYIDLLVPVQWPSYVCKYNARHFSVSQRNTLFGMFRSDGVQSVFYVCMTVHFYSQPSHRIIERNSCEIPNRKFDDMQTIDHKIACHTLFDFKLRWKPWCTPKI